MKTYIQSVKSRVDWLRLHFVGQTVRNPIHDEVGLVTELVIHGNEDDIQVEVEIAENGKVRYRHYPLDELKIITFRHKE